MGTYLWVCRHIRTGVWTVQGRIDRVKLTEPGSPAEHHCFWIAGGINAGDWKPKELYTASFKPPRLT